MLSIVIPAWNEEKTIERAIRETSTALGAITSPAEIIVVDDGSIDGTSDIVEKMETGTIPTQVIRHDRNQGKGAAVRTGALAARGEWILFLDADLSVHPSEISRLMSAMENADIVIGSRRVRDAEIPEPQPFARDSAGRIFNLIARMITGLPYRDTQCGFKAFHRRTIPIFESLTSTGWSFDVELLQRASRAHFRIQEIPVTWRHGRESRVKWQDAGKILMELWKIRTLRR